MDRKVAQFTPVLIIIITLLLTFILRQEEGKSDRFHSVKQFALGTIVEITLSDKDSEGAIDEAFAEIARIEQLMGPDLKSEATQLSADKHEITLSSETQSVITEALAISHRSGGAFDITLGKLKKLWNIDQGGTLPSSESITAAVQGVGVDSLEIRDNKLWKRTKSLHIDLGGIAKGYAVDRAVAILRKHGVASASINAGGDLYLLGKRHDREWKIAIQHPRQPDSVIAVISVADRAIVTSGDYERFFEKDGIRYHHLFDPKTGYPANKCQSVTVVASSAMYADAIATAAFVLGPQEGIKFIESYSDTEGFIIDKQGDKYVTTGLAGRIEWR